LRLGRLRGLKSSKATLGKSIGARSEVTRSLLSRFIFESICLAAVFWPLPSSSKISSVRRGFVAKDQNADDGQNQTKANGRNKSKVSAEANGRDQDNFGTSQASPFGHIAKGFEGGFLFPDVHVTAMIFGAHLCRLLCENLNLESRYNGVPCGSSHWHRNQT
jgi:hypothetical protein